MIEKKENILKIIFKGSVYIFLACHLHAFSSAEEREKKYPVDESFKTDFNTRSLVGTLTHLHKFMPVCEVKPSESPKEILKTQKLDDFKFKRLLTSSSLREYPEGSGALGITVFDGSKIVHQRFFNDRNESDLMPSYSMSKSIISLMIGIAAGEGKIKSLDDTVGTYAPRLSNSAYSNVTIRNLLRMSSGVPFIEEYDGRDDITQFAKLSMGPGGDIINAISQIKRDSKNQGAKFNYASIETAVLTEVLRAATGIEPCKYFETKLWKPIGAKNPSYWVTDAKGETLGYTLFLATQDDFLKLGILLANNGALDGNQIIPAWYIEEATNVEKQPPHLQFGKVNRISGYGYQFWLSSVPGRFAMWGIRGQSMYIDQKTKKVLLINSAWVTPLNSINRLSMYSMFEQFVTLE